MTEKGSERKQKGKERLQKRSKLLKVSPGLTSVREET